MVIESRFFAGCLRLHSARRSANCSFPGGSRTTPTLGALKPRTIFPSNQFVVRRVAQTFAQFGQLCFVRFERDLPLGVFRQRWGPVSINQAASTKLHKTKLDWRKICTRR